MLGLMLREHIPLYINALRTGPNMCGGEGGVFSRLKAVLT
jgi:hypothetical protein